MCGGQQKEISRANEETNKGGKTKEKWFKNQRRHQWLKISWRPKEIVEKVQVSRDTQRYAWSPMTLLSERPVPTV